MASFRVMPRQTKKALKARLEKAHEQWVTLALMVPVKWSEEDLRKAEEETARFELMTDEELDEYYRSPEGLAELAYERQLDREQEEFEAIPIEERPNPLGRRLIRRGKVEFYQNVVTRVVQGMPRQKIADELRVSVDTIKIALRVVRRLTGQDYTRHQHKKLADFNRCPQCRGYANSGNRKPYDEKLDGTAEPRRKHKRNEISQSRRNMQRGETDEEDENTEQTYIDQTYMKNQSKEGFPRPCAVCSEIVYSVADAIERHRRCAGNIELDGPDDSD